MDERERADEIIRIFEAEYPFEKGTILHWETPLELLVATILSAQSTDDQINKLTPALLEVQDHRRLRIGAPGGARGIHQVLRVLPPEGRADPGGVPPDRKRVRG